MAGNADGGDEDHPEVHRDSLGASAGLVGNSEMLAWGGGGIRSNNRHSNISAGKEKIARTIRLSKLLDTFKDTVEVDKVVIKCRIEGLLVHTTVIWLGHSYLVVNC